MTYHYGSRVFHLDETPRQIRLHGDLGEKFGASLTLAATSPREVIRALAITRPGFSEMMREGKYHLVLSRNEKELELDLEGLDFEFTSDRTLHIIPAVEGGKKPGLGKVLAGVALIGLSFIPGMAAVTLPAMFGGMTLAGAAGLMGIGMAVGGLASMLAPTPKLGDYSDREEQAVSYLMNGVVNTSEEGGAVPVALGGPVMCGSHVVSSGLDVEDMNIGGGNGYSGGGGVIGGGGGYTGPIDPGNPNSPYNDWLRDTFNNQQYVGGDKGGKGGGQARAARETPNSVAAETVARIIDLVSSGDIEGWEDPEHPFRNVYLDETVVENSDGTRNFSGLEMHIRHGAPGQDYIPGFSQAENIVGVSVEVKASQPVTRAVTSDPQSGLRIDRVKAIMRFPALTQLDTATGDLNGASVSYRIGIIPNGGAVQWAVNHTLSEKFTSTYQRAHVIDLPETGHPYQLRVERLTPDSTSSTLANETYLDALVEIVDAKLSYPGSALVALTAYARQFGDRIPSRGYMLKGVICDVPSNYDPDSRVYTGQWDGTFVRKFTNNPAWILWTALTNHEWGMGKRIPRKFVDKWSFYEIATYSDKYVSDGSVNPELFNTLASAKAVRKAHVRAATRSSHSVSNRTLDGIEFKTGERALFLGQAAPSGNGIYQWNGSQFVRSADTGTAALIRDALVRVTEGTYAKQDFLQSELDTAANGYRFASVQPRYQFNMWINSREDVYTAMQTIASSFRGMLIWGRGMVMSMQDAPKAPRRLITNANVKGGAFVYEGIGRKAIHSVALVTWVNPADGWKANVEVVENPELIELYGWKPIDVFAPGCTNRAQARRTGAWTLYTEQFESELVTFSGDLDLADIVPGEIIQVADADQIGLRMHGRLREGPRNGSGGTVTLDAAFQFMPGEEYQIYLTDAEGGVSTRIVTNGPGTTDVVNFTPAFPNGAPFPQGDLNSVFILTSTSIAPRLFRALRFAENEGAEFEIIAAEHHPGKYDLIEAGVVFEPRPNSIYDSTVPPGPPTDLDLIRQTINTPSGPREELSLVFQKSTSPLVTKYVARWRYKLGQWTELETITDNVSFSFQGPGAYDVILYGVDVRGKQTVPVAFTKDIDAYRDIEVSPVVNLKIKDSPSTENIFSGDVLQLEWNIAPPEGYSYPISAGDLDNPDSPAFKERAEFLSNWEDPYFRDYEIQILAGDEILAKFYTKDKFFSLSSELHRKAVGLQHRNPKVHVRMRDRFNSESDGPTRTFFNQPPKTNEIPVVVQSYNGEVVLTYVDPSDEDYRGILVRMDTANPPSPASIVHDSRAQPRIKGDRGEVVYLQWAFYDSWGKAGLTWSSVTSIKISGVEVGDIDFDAEFDELFRDIRDQLAAADVRLETARAQLEALISTGNDRYDALIAALELDIDGIVSTTVTLREELDTRASLTQLQVERVRIDGHTSEIGSLTTQIADVELNKVSTTRFDTLESEIVGARGGSLTLNARMQVMSQALVDGLAGTASVSRAEQLEASIEDESVRITGAIGRLDDIQLDLNGKATLTQLSTLGTRVTTAEGSLSGALGRLDTVEIDLSGKVAVTEFTSLRSEVENARSGFGTLSAAFSNLNTVITDGLEGKASVDSVTQLSLAVGGFDGRITDAMSLATDADGALRGLVTNQIDINGVITGTYSINDGIRTGYRVRTDVFELVPSTTSGTRMTYQNGKFTIYSGNIDVIQLGVGVNG